MNKDDTFSDAEAQSSSRPGADSSSDNPAQSSLNAHQDTSSSATLPSMEQRRLSHRYMRLSQVAMVVLVLVALAGGYGVFRAISQHSRQTSSAFQVTYCPFPPGAGLVEGRNVRCGFLTVPEDWGHPQGPSIRLAVEIFKTPSSQPAPDPVLFLSGRPGDALLETLGRRLYVGNLA